MFQMLQIKDTEPGTFCGLEELEILDLQYNKLSKVPELTPLKLTLSELFLSYNQLSRFPDDYFQGFVKLQHLHISYNHMQAVPSLGWLAPTLKTLHSGKNNITSIEGFVTDKWFDKLHKLDLSKNKINAFDVEILLTMPKLRYLYIYGNFITHLGDYRPYFSHVILLSANPFHCDMRMAWITTVTSEFIGAPTCATPWCLKGRRISNMSKWINLDLNVTTWIYILNV